MAALRPSDIRGLQADLLARKYARTGEPLSVKTVKNVINGSLRALLRDAVEEGFVTRDVFPKLKWPKRDLPEADPFEADEVRRIRSGFSARSSRFTWCPRWRSSPRRKEDRSSRRHSRRIGTIACELSGSAYAGSTARRTPTSRGRCRRCAILGGSRSRPASRSRY